MRGAGVARALGALLAAGLLLAVVLLAGLQGDTGRGRGSVRSADDDGWLALYLTFEELDLAPEAWTGALQELPVGRHTLWWARAPVEQLSDEPLDEPAPETERERDALDRWLEQSPQAPRHLRRFLVQGGCLVAVPTPELLAWLQREAGLDELDGARLESRSRVAGPVRGADGERFGLEALLVRQLVELAPEAAHEVLLAEEDGTPLVLSVAVGRGAVVLLPNESMLSNRALREGDAARFAVRLAETLAPGGRQLFDEGLGARGAAPRLGELLAGPTLRLASLHLLALALVALWAALVPRGFAREPRRSERVSALERARARAGLALRAGHAASLAAPLRDGVLRRAARRLRVRPGEGELGPRLAALHAAAGARLDRERWRRALGREVADDPEALAELDRELRALESELGAPQDARPHTPSPPRRAARPMP